MYPGGLLFLGWSVSPDPIGTVAGLSLQMGFMEGSQGGGNTEISASSLKL